VIAGSGGVGWLDRDEAGVVEIETVDEHIDRSHRVFLGHIVIERCREKCALPAIDPFNKALHQMPRKIAGNLIARITANRAFSHSLGPKRTSRTGLAMSVDGGRPEVAPVASSAPRVCIGQSFYMLWQTAGNPAAIARNPPRASRGGLRAPAVATRRECVAQYWPPVRPRGRCACRMSLRCFSTDQ